MKLNKLSNDWSSENWLQKDNELSLSIADALDNIDKDQQELLWYAKELALTSYYAFKDCVSWEKNTDGFRDRNKKAKDNFLRLFEKKYGKAVLTTDDGQVLKLEDSGVKFTSNSNIYDLYFVLDDKYQPYDKYYTFKSWWRSTPIYQEYIIHHPWYVDGMNTQFKFDKKSRKLLEEMLSYNNNSTLFQNYRISTYDDK